MKVFIDKIWLGLTDRLVINKLEKQMESEIKEKSVGLQF